MIELAAPWPLPQNEPTLSYAPGSAERAALKSELARLAGQQLELPHVVSGRELHEGEPFAVRMPHDHAHVLGHARHGAEAVAAQAVAASRTAARDWAEAPFEQRARVFLRAAELAAGPYRARLNAATMLGQSKTAHQAEIDSACELIDFLRFNVAYATRLWEQPLSPKEMRNTLEPRPLEGFVLALTPFNFTAIAANLPSAPALLGNVVVWKPSESQALSAHYTMQLFRDAGLPDGVINLVHGDGASVAEYCLAQPDLAGVHFTGSTQILRHLTQRLAEHAGSYRGVPRLVGETGGKDFVVAHPSAQVDALAVALVRGAFEFQGQKCSAASRAYVPRSLWPAVRERVLAEMAAIRQGDVRDFRNFMGAVIHERAYDRLDGWRRRLLAEPATKVHGAERWSKEQGYFAAPTLVELDDPEHELLHTELFGPVLGVVVYEDRDWTATLARVDRTSPYALTGAVFAQDRAAIDEASRVLRHAAGNFYINDKPTGAVVGQQPFGGGRASGTNDKAGSPLNLLRWVSPRTVKETFVPATEVGYPFMLEP